jgi:hypothetical protein
VLVKAIVFSSILGAQYLNEIFLEFFKTVEENIGECVRSSDNVKCPPLLLKII